MALVNAAHFYHLNIGVGDCTIVVELDEARNPKTLVLIDGGTFNDGAAMIKAWITGWVLGEYRVYETGAKKPVFGRIVITHWDEDHYGE